MQQTIFALLLLLLSTLVMAQPAISIMPLHGDKDVSMDHPKTLSGHCGKSLIRLEGVTRLADDHFKHDYNSGKIVLQQGDADLSIEDRDEILNDYNGIACVETKIGARLLIWSYCGGGMCGDSLKFHVLDPNKPSYITSRTGDCDGDCASNHMKQHPLPLDIAKRFASQFGTNTSTVALLDNENEESDDCPIPGQSIHWVTDFCMMKLGSVDVNNNGIKACIEENRTNGLSNCDAKKRYKQQMCELEAANYDVDIVLCLAGTEITGLTVRNHQQK